MIFSYVCNHGHESQKDFPVGKAPSKTYCQGENARFPGIPCAEEARRDFAADFSTVTIATGDPFRSEYLSTRWEKTQADQGRRIDAPRDNFERKRMERELGRVYVGNETGGMTKGAQSSISEYREKKKAGEKV